MNTKIRSLTLVFLVLFGLSGCLEQITKPGEQSDDAQRTKTEGMFAGAAVGFLAGMLTADGDDKLKHGLIGAAIGAGAGYVVGNEIAKRKQKYKSREELIAQESAHTATLLKEARAINADLRADINAYRTQSKTLKAKVAQGKADKRALAEQKNQVDKRHADSRKALKAVEKELSVSEQMYKDAKAQATKADKAKLREWQKRIRDLKKEKRALQKHSGQLQSISATLG